MLTLTALVLLVAPPAPPADLDRFPDLNVCRAQLGALIRVRCALHQSPPSPERADALRYNARQFAAWEVLLEARGGLADEGLDLDDAGLRRALEALRAVIGEEAWRAGRML